MFERFTAAARDVVVSAHTYAREFRHSEIGAEHLLLATLADDQGVAAQFLGGLGADLGALRAEIESLGSPDTEALKTIGIDLDAVRRQAEESFGPGALSRSRRQRPGLFGHRFSGGGHIPFTKEAKTALEMSLREAVAHKDNYIGSEHLLLGLLATERATALALLRRVGVNEGGDEIKRQVLARLRRTA